MTDLHTASDEANTHSFIVKIWLDDNSRRINQVTWRGHITHIPSGERHFITDLNEIQRYISPYLESMGVKRGLSARLRSWFMRLGP